MRPSIGQYVQLGGFPAMFEVIAKASDDDSIVSIYDALQGVDLVNH